MSSPFNELLAMPVAFSAEREESIEKRVNTFQLTYVTPLERGCQELCGQLISIFGTHTPTKQPTPRSFQRTILCTCNNFLGHKSYL